MTLMAPTETGDMMQSLVNDAAQGGWLPKWPVANGYSDVMNGDAADPILAEALAFGARNFDTNTALAQMVKGATQVPTPAQRGQGYSEERPGLAAYLKLGYVPNTSICCVSPVPNGASETLEYALADSAIAQFARIVGDMATFHTFMRRAQNWQNQFNPGTGYIQPRDAHGAFPVGDPTMVGMGGFGQSGFQEGNGAQYTWMIQQNLHGLFT